jgi:hypothetical protein
MSHNIKCAKCGRALAVASSEASAKARRITRSNYAVRIDYSRKGNVAWAVCKCGHETRISDIEGKSRKI